MSQNETIRTLREHRSVRKFTDQPVDDGTIEEIVRAGQQAPFAYQCYSVVMSRDAASNPFGAPVCFAVCADYHKFELIMARRGWKRVTNDLTALIFAVEDASYAAQNMVIAARSLGLGSCFIGAPLVSPSAFAKAMKIPPKVYPLVLLAIGHPAEEPPVRPRYPLGFTLFEDEYPEMTETMLDEAMRAMDEGYLAQDYYRRINYMVELPEGRKETHTFDDYSWTEHISRKLGIWCGSLDEQKAALRERGFEV